LGKFSQAGSGVLAKNFTSSYIGLATTPRTPE
jgi:hypothetical protein